MSALCKRDTLIAMAETLICDDLAQASLVNNLAISSKDNANTLHKHAVETSRDIADALEGLGELIDFIQPNSGMEEILMPKLASNLRILGSVLKLSSRTADLTHATRKSEG